MNLEQPGQHSPTKLQDGEKSTLLGMKSGQCSREQPRSNSDAGGITMDQLEVY